MKSRKMKKVLKGKEKKGEEAKKGREGRGTGRGRVEGRGRGEGWATWWPSTQAHFPVTVMLVLIEVPFTYSYILSVQCAALGV